MSHIIFTSALIALIFLMQFSFTFVVDNMKTEMIKRELKEITDYVSDTLANLYFLVNSTNYSNVALEKTLILPSDVQGSTYSLLIHFNATTFEALSVNANITGSLGAEATSWLLPSLMVNSTATESIVSSGKTVVARCSRVSTSVLVWIAYK